MERYYKTRIVILDGNRVKIRERKLGRIAFDCDRSLLFSSKLAKVKLNRYEMPRRGNLGAAFWSFGGI